LAFYAALGYTVEERVSMGKVLGTPASTSDVTFLRKVSPGGIDMRIDHIQLAMPEGGEVEARRFFGGLLGLEETPKPETLRSTGGCWFRGDGCELHLGVDPDFRPQRKAHPGFVVAKLHILARSLEAGRLPRSVGRPHRRRGALLHGRPLRKSPRVSGRVSGLI
jgi:hypothetical protein